MTLRDYLPSDLDALVALDELCFEPPFRFPRAAMLRFAEAQNAGVTLAETAEGSLAGFCILHIERHSPHPLGYIVTLDVAAERRRQGLAGELMQRAEDQAREAGCAAVVLHVFTGNAGAIRFYERRGYLFDHRVPGFYGPGTDALVYRKPLGFPPPPVSV
jgi:ribosomal-protein-alanine N-acetyltransferase